MRGGAAALNAQRLPGESERRAATSPAAISGDANNPHKQEDTLVLVSFPGGYNRDAGIRLDNINVLPCVWMVRAPH